MTDTTLTDTTFAQAPMRRTTRSRGTAARPRSFVARALFGNLALLSGIVVMPIVILVGYLLGGHG